MRLPASHRCAGAKAAVYEQTNRTQQTVEAPARVTTRRMTPAALPPLREQEQVDQVRPLGYETFGPETARGWIARPRKSCRLIDTRHPRSIHSGDLVGVSLRDCSERGLLHADRLRGGPWSVNEAAAGPSADTDAIDRLKTLLQDRVPEVART